MEPAEDRPDDQYNLSQAWISAREPQWSRPRIGRTTARKN
jgi:hypothetical protein